MAYVRPSLFWGVLQRKPKTSQRLFVTSFQVHSLVRCDAVIWYVCSFGETCSFYHLRRQNLTTHIKYYFFTEILTKEIPVLFKLRADSRLSEGFSDYHRKDSVIIIGRIQWLSTEGFSDYHRKYSVIINGRIQWLSAEWFSYCHRKDSVIVIGRIQWL
jgi:hypothetical protein